MGNYIAPYAKENNLLQLPVFYFVRNKKMPTKTKVEWADKEGQHILECICKYGVPGSFEQDVFAASMRIWVRSEMPSEGIYLNYSDIARELHLFPIKAWVGKIKNALEKLGQARYHLTKCFIKADINGNEKTNAHFSLFDSVLLYKHEKGKSKSKRNSQSRLIFPKILKENLEANYYQLLDMVWYRALPEGLPRRLYEYLDKHRYHSINCVFIISEEALCRWLPVTDKNPTTRRKTLMRIAQALIDKGYLLKYEFNRKKRQCLFTYNTKAKQREYLEKHNGDTTQTTLKEVIPVETVTKETEPVEHKEQELQQELEQKITPQDQAAYFEALEWINKIPYFHKKRREEIAALKLTHVAECYPRIRRKYEALKTAKKEVGPGWIYNAFKDGYLFQEDIAEKQAEEKQEKECQLREKIAAVKQLIEDKGIKKVQYSGSKILSIVEVGLWLEPDKAVLWDQVELEYFTVVD